MQITVEKRQLHRVEVGPEIRLGKGGIRVEVVRRKNGEAEASLDLEGLGKEVDPKASLATVTELGVRIKSQEVIQVILKFKEVIKKTGPKDVIKTDPRGREKDQRVGADLKENTRKDLKIGLDQDPTVVNTSRAGRVKEVKGY